MSLADARVENARHAFDAQVLERLEFGPIVLRKSARRVAQDFDRNARLVFFRALALGEPGRSLTTQPERREQAVTVDQRGPLRGVGIRRHESAEHASSEIARAESGHASAFVAGTCAVAWFAHFIASIDSDWEPLCTRDATM